MALAKRQIDKAQLERICAQYLRPKGHRVERVTIARSPNPARNWFVAEIEPPLSLVNELHARAALGELQREFRLEEWSRAAVALCGVVGERLTYKTVGGMSA